MTFKGLLLVLFIGMLTLNAQDYFPKKDKFGGKYYSLNKMGIPEQETKEVYLAVGTQGTTKMMTLSLTKGGMPAYFVFDQLVSKKIKKTAFRNRSSMVFTFDENSLVMVREKFQGNKPETEKIYDFFSRDKAKVSSMTKEKLMKYALKYVTKFKK